MTIYYGSYTDQKYATQVAFDGDDIYILAYWFPDAWLKGTIDAETGITTFPAGQFAGRDNAGLEFMHGFDGEGICDIQFAYDAEAKN